MSDIELHRSGPSQYCDHEVWHAYQNKGVNAPSSYGFEENWRLVTDELVEVRDFRTITDHFRGIYRIYLK